jgi:hypothetical protein
MVRIRIGLAIVLALLVTALTRVPAVGGDNDAPLVIQSPSPSPTGSPSPSPSPSPSESPSPEPSPNPRFRRVTLSASRRHVKVGRRVRFRGRVIANRPGCSVAARVTLRRLILGTDRSLVVASRRTDADGRFRFRDTVRWSSLYTAVAHREAGCGRRKSDPAPLFAHVWFKITVSDTSPARFTSFRISGRVQPSHPDTRALLQKKRGKRWRTIQRQRLNSQSSFSFVPFANWEGQRAFRVKWPKADRDHEKGASRSILIRTHS